ncbi:MAG: hypothetical protein IPK78_19835 [Rhodospirillales bacterium]|nr:hypothetical protein [Rhodospirillales bacterium]
MVLTTMMTLIGGVLTRLTQQARAARQALARLGLTPRLTRLRRRMSARSRLQRGALLDRLLCLTGKCRRLVVIDTHSRASDPLRCIRCGRAHGWIDPAEMAGFRARTAWMGRGWWIEDIGYGD